MEAMALVAILVNCALIGLSGQVQRMFPEMSATQTILLIVALEHIMLIIRFVIVCAIPDMPSWIATEMAKVEFARREAVSRLSSTPSPSEHQSSTVIGMFRMLCEFFFFLLFVSFIKFIRLLASFIRNAIELRALLMHFFFVLECLAPSALTIFIQCRRKYYF